MSCTALRAIETLPSRSLRIPRARESNSRRPPSRHSIRRPRCFGRQDGPRRVTRNRLCRSRARAAKIEVVRDAVSCDAGRTSGDAIAIARPASHRLDLRVVVRGNSDENPDGPPRAIGGLTAVFECLPCQLEKQSMLRVDEDSFTGRDAEKIGIELVDTLRNPPRCGISSFLTRRHPIAKPGRADPIDAIAQHFPERLGSARAGEPAPDSDDRDRSCAIPVRVEPSPALGETGGSSPRDRPVRRLWDNRRRAWGLACVQATPPARPRAARPGASRCRSSRGGSGSTSSGPMPSGAATLATSQAAIASATGLAGLAPRMVRQEPGSTGPVRFRARSGPAGHDVERARKERSRQAALHLPA